MDRRQHPQPLYRTCGESVPAAIPSAFRYSRNVARPFTSASSRSAVGFSCEPGSSRLGTNVKTSPTTRRSARRRRPPGRRSQTRAMGDAEGHLDSAPFLRRRRTPPSLRHLPLPPCLLSTPPCSAWSTPLRLRPHRVQLCHLAERSHSHRHPVGKRLCAALRAHQSQYKAHSLTTRSPRHPDRKHVRSGTKDDTCPCDLLIADEHGARAFRRDRRPKLHDEAPDSLGTDDPRTQHLNAQRTDRG